MKKLMFLCLLCFSMQAFSQSADKIHDIFAFNRKLIALYTSNNDTLQSKACFNGCVFVRFTVDSTGTFSNFSCTKNTPAFLSDGLQQAFSKLSASNVQLTKNWQNQTYLLPLIVYYQAGCNVKPEQKSQSKPDQLIVSDHFDETINDILNFADGRKDALKCTVLSPITFSSKI